MVKKNKENIIKELLIIHEKVTTDTRIKDKPIYLLSIGENGFTRAIKLSKESLMWNILWSI